MYVRTLSTISSHPFFLVQFDPCLFLAVESADDLLDDLHDPQGVLLQRGVQPHVRPQFLDGRVAEPARKKGVAHQIRRREDNTENHLLCEELLALGKLFKQPEKGLGDAALGTSADVVEVMTHLQTR